MSEVKVTRAERALERLAVRTGMTESGLQWLKAAVDPFHDTELSVDGYPDMTTSKSIVECVKQSVTVTVAGSPKDLLVRLDNSATNQQLIQQVNITNGNYYQNPAVFPGTTCGGCTIIAADSGSNLNQNTSANYSNTASMSVPARYLQRRSRVIASGFEVHNISPELVKGGSVTVFEQAQNNESHSHGMFSSANVNCGAIDYFFNEPVPFSEADATLLPGSKTWDASAGAYCIQKQQSIDNPGQMVDYVGIMSTRDPLSGTPIDINFPNVPGFPMPISPFVFVIVPGGGENQPKKMIPFNSCGAYFTGLPVGSVLKINWNVWIERFPSVSDRDLIVLCKPSCCFDPVALEAYARIMQMMPVGVPVKENGLGDWFAGTVAVLIDSLLGGPYVSTALGFANSLMGSTNQNNSNPNVETRRDVIIERREPQKKKSTVLNVKIPRNMPPLPPTPPKQGKNIKLKNFPTK